MHKLSPVFLMMLAMTAGASAAAERPATATHLEGRSYYRAPLSTAAMQVDGIGDEAVWARAEWRALDHKWLGPDYEPDDFSGRYKVAWTPERIYLIAEIRDDVLYDAHRDPLVQYWDDDCLEVFVDEDHSGGNHQYNHNAFAYHFSLDNRAIDIGTNGEAQEYTHHVQSRWRATGDLIVWEVAIDIYPDSYVDGADDNEPVVLTVGKIMGLMLAYCDNDGSELRENFVGSEAVDSGPKDRGWIDAGLFGTLELVE